MVEATLTSEMKEILSNMKGKTLLSYVCEKDDGFSRPYGNMRIITDSFSIELINEEHPLTFFDGIEDISYFEIKEVNPETPFEPFVVTETEEFKVNKIITGIEIINDTINVKDREYVISFDEAIVIHMPEDVLMLARDSWFSEVISICHDDDYNKVCSIDELIEEWSNEGEDKVLVDRRRFTVC